MLNAKRDNLENGFLKPEYPFKQPTKCSQIIDWRPQLSTMITSGLQNLVLSKLDYLILTH